MKTCKKCNITYDDDKKFCKKCGSPLETEFKIESKEDAKKLIFEEKLKADPLNVDLLCEYVQFLFNNSMLKDSIPVALKLLAINENDTLTKEILFNTYLKLEMFEKATKIGDELLKEKPNDITLLEKIGNINEKEKKFSEALEIYNSVLAIQPSNSEVLFRKAVVLAKTNQILEALPIFAVLKAEGNEDKLVTIYAGIDRAINGEYKSAIDIFTSVLSTKKSYQGIHYNRGLLYQTYSLSQSNLSFENINIWFSMIDLTILNDNHNNLDEEILAKTVSLIVNYILISWQVDEKFEKDLPANIIHKTDFYFTGQTKEIIAETWYNIASNQIKIGYYEDAKESLTEATQLMPGVNKYDEELINIISLINKYKRKKNRNATIILISLAIIIIVGIFSVFAYKKYKDNKSWEMAQAQNNPSSVHEYLSKYPNGHHRDKAKELYEKLYEDLKWEETKSLNTLDAVNDYLKQFPNGKHITDALTLKENVIWEKALEINSELYYRNYLIIFPNGKHATEAIKFQDKAAWKKASESNTIEAYSNYLFSYPEGISVSFAKEKIRKLNIGKPSPVLDTTIDNTQSTTQGNVLYVNKDDKVFFRAFDIDDTGECFINGKKVFQVKWGDGVVGHAAGKSNWIDVSSHLNKPENHINFKGINNSGCCYFSYGFQIKINNVIAWEDKKSIELSNAGVYYDKKLLIKHK
jgi:hypothetical protein